MLQSAVACGVSRCAPDPPRESSHRHLSSPAAVTADRFRLSRIGGDVDFAAFEQKLFVVLKRNADTVRSLFDAERCLM